MHYEFPNRASRSLGAWLPPVSGTYVMTAEEAVEAAAAIQPKVAIPMHIGERIGLLADAERFRDKATVPVVVKQIKK